jgi:hypothetical protein
VGGNVVHRPNVSVLSIKNRSWRDIQSEDFRGKPLVLNLRARVVAMTDAGSTVSCEDALAPASEEIRLGQRLSAQAALCAWAS